MPPVFYIKFAGFSGFKSFVRKIPSWLFRSRLLSFPVNCLNFRSRKRPIENGDIFNFTVEKTLVGRIGMISNPQRRRVRQVPWHNSRIKRRNHVPVNVKLEPCRRISLDRHRHMMEIAVAQVRSCGIEILNCIQRIRQLEGTFPPAR